MRHAKLYYALCIDYFWTTDIKHGGGDGEFSIARDHLNIPLYPKYKWIEYDGLSARLKSEICRQSLGAISAAVEKRKKLLWGLSKATTDRNKKNILNKLKEYPLVKPSIPINFSIEVSSSCANFKRHESKAIFGILKLSALGAAFKNIYIPIQKYKYLAKYSENQEWHLKGSFRVSNSCISLRWERTPSKTLGKKIVGGDTGFKTVLTLSDGQSTPHTDCHGHSLESICRTMIRKKKGSLSYRRSQDHRENFIHWSINQLNLNKVKEIRLEEVVNINYGRKASKLMARWANSIIERKVSSIAEEKDVSFVLQKSAYRSQRCSSCSLVLKSNRKDKVYKCKACKIQLDSDLNGAKNHEINLPPIPWWLFNSKLNRKGFFWKPEGLYGLDGQELRVPDIPKNIIK